MGIVNGLQLSFGNIACSFCFFVALCIYRNHRRPRTPRLQGPPSRSFLFGVSEEVLGTLDVGALFRAWEKAYGSVYETPSSLGSRVITLNDPTAIAHFFSKDTFAYHQPGLLKAFLRDMPNALLIVEGEAHKRQRRALSGAFSMSAIRDLTPVFFDCAHRLKDGWKTSFNARHEAKSLTIDVQKWMNHVALDIIGNAGFSHDFGALKGKTSPVMTALDSFGAIKPSRIVKLVLLVGSVFPGFFSRIPTKRTEKGREMDNALKQIAGELLEKVEEAKATGVHASDKSILGTLVNSENANAKKQMSINEITAQIYLLMIAARETVATTLTWALIELARNPNIQSTLRAEFNEQLGPGEDPTYDQLTNDLPYLDAFMLEVLRRNPAVREIVRVAVEDDVIPLADTITTASGDVIDRLFIEKGTAMRVPTAGVHWSESLWGPDAATFDPQRWLTQQEPGRLEEIQGYKHLLSFASGPRTCPGKNFAMTELKAIISVLVRNYAFGFPHGPKTALESHMSLRVRPKVAGEDGAKVPLTVTKILAD